MLKYYQFRPTVKYVTTPYTPKIIIKKFIKYIYKKKFQAKKEKKK